MLQCSVHRGLHGDCEGWEEGPEMYSLLQRHVPGQMPYALPPDYLHGQCMQAYPALAE